MDSEKLINLFEMKLDRPPDYLWYNFFFLQFVNSSSVLLVYEIYFWHLYRKRESKLLFFFVAYLPELAADLNKKKKNAVSTLGIKNVFACQISV